MAKAAAFDAELALDRLLAELALELPAHMRAFARAYATGAALPPAPAAAQRATSLATARRALAHPKLAGRALALARLLAPIAIESDPRVAAARMSSASWEGYAVLAAARDAAASTVFGLGFIELVHELHGASAPASSGWPDPVPGWNSPHGAIDGAALAQIWHAIAARFGVRGTCRIIHAAARPRAFIVDDREVIVVIGEVNTPAARFAALHEFGHAVAALHAGALPRVVDEAVAAYVARQLEVDGAWYTPLAEPARKRRRQLAAALDRIERGIELRPPALERPPWALWHDPGAQAAYVAAEELAERFWAVLGPTPEPGAFAAALADARARIERASTLR